MRNETFLAILLLLALILACGCQHAMYKGGTYYSHVLCEAGVDAYGNGQRYQACTGGLKHGK